MVVNSCRVAFADKLGVQLEAFANSMSLEFVSANGTASAASNGRRNGMARSCDGENVKVNLGRVNISSARRFNLIAVTRVEVNQADCNPQNVPSGDDSRGPKEQSVIPALGRP